MSPDPKWQPRNQREAAAMDRNVARCVAGAPKGPMPDHRAYKIVALMWPHGLTQPAITTRKKAS